MTRNRLGAAMVKAMQPLQASYDAGYETAEQEFVAMHDGFVQSHESFAEKVKAKLIGSEAIAHLPSTLGGLLA